jgi:hypothetical protein
MDILPLLVWVLPPVDGDGLYRFVSVVVPVPPNQPVFAVLGLEKYFIRNIHWQNR